MPIPIGGVVTVDIHPVDRSHTDGRRLPGVIVDISIHDEMRFYKVGVVGGILKDSDTRPDLIYESNLVPNDYDLEGVLEQWRNLPKISVHQAVANISQTGGQGHLKCSCTIACRTPKCTCFKANRKCNSRCHKKNSRCLNHDECEVISENDFNTSDDEDFEILNTQPHRETRARKTK